MFFRCSGSPKQPCENIAHLPAGDHVGRVRVVPRSGYAVDQLFPLLGADGVGEAGLRGDPLDHVVHVRSDRLRQFVLPGSAGLGNTVVGEIRSLEQGAGESVGGAAGEGKGVPEGMGEAGPGVVDGDPGGAGGMGKTLPVLLRPSRALVLPEQDVPDLPRREQSRFLRRRAGLRGKIGLHGVGQRVEGGGHGVVVREGIGIARIHEGHPRIGGDMLEGLLAGAAVDGQHGIAHGLAPRSGGGGDGDDRQAGIRPLRVVVDIVRSAGGIGGISGDGLARVECRTSPGGDDEIASLSPRKLSRFMAEGSRRILGDLRKSHERASCPGQGGGQIRDGSAGVRSVGSRDEQSPPSRFPEYLGMGNDAVFAGQDPHRLVGGKVHGFPP